MAKILLIIVLIVAALLFLFSIDFSRSAEFTYGISFSRFHADELGLDWKEVYLAVLNDLGVKNFRFSAHWPLTEPQPGIYNFKELDFQIQEAQKKGASVILAVGRRLPGWPECHEPEWLKNELSKIQDQGKKTEFKRETLLRYIEEVVNRYKGYGNIKYWQVENEPFLEFFSRTTCGELDENLLDEEIELVRRLDPSRPILLTDSGEFGTWVGAYERGDIFGTSMYLYIWNRKIGPFRYPIGPVFFRIKQNLTRLIYGKKQAIVIELSSEPWLLQSIVETPVDIQLQRMGIDKFNEMLNFSAQTGFDTFYLWGAEWWYWMRFQNHPEFWDRAGELYK